MMHPAIRQMIDAAMSSQPPKDPPPPPIDGPRRAGDDGGMEQRLTEVEKAIVRLDGRLDHIDSSLSEIKDSVKTWKWQVLGAAIAVLLASWYGNYTIQQMTVATFVAAAQQQKDAQPQPAQLPPIIINVPAAPQPAPPASR